MKLKLLLIIIIIFNSKIQSQSIYSALRHDDKLDLKDNIQVEEIVTDIIFYNTNSIENQKEITIVNSKNKLVREDRYNDQSKIAQKLTFSYDSTQTKSLSRKHEKWHPLLGYSSETAFYEYDPSDFLIKIIDKNKDGKIFRETSITNDDKGNPIELKLKENNNFDYGMETAEYDYENNVVEIKVLDEHGNILSSNKMKIDFSIKSKDDVVNDSGDYIKSDGYEFDYKYDKKGNWIKQIRYKVVAGKKIKNAEFVRKIKYVK